jgi:hypothetical protein
VCGLCFLCFLCVGETVENWCIFLYFDGMTRVAFGVVR